jgi:uncharacterized protein
LEASVTTLIVPGLRGSGPGHWQDWWLRNDPNAVRVEQDDWHRPSFPAWSEPLIAAIDAHPYAWLVAHSLGATLVTRIAAMRLDLRIAGALLVAPADVDELETWSLRSFAPMSLAPLPFPATVVASRSDPYLSFRRARSLASAWGARLVDYGDAGHINVAAGYGPWPQGPGLLADLRRRQAQPETIIHLRPRLRPVGGNPGALP